MRYLRDDYDAGADANMLMQESASSCSAAAASRRLRWRARPASPGAARQPALAGWGLKPRASQYWARVLVTLMRDWDSTGLLPLGAPRFKGTALRSVLGAGGGTRSARFDSSSVADAPDNAPFDVELELRLSSSGSSSPAAQSANGSGEIASGRSV